MTKLIQVTNEDGSAADPIPLDEFVELVGEKIFEDTERRRARREAGEKPVPNAKGRADR